MRLTAKPFLAVCLPLLLAGGAALAQKAGEEALGSRKYSDFEKPKFCGTSCHVDFYRQWEQEMHSQAYTHHWDEIEYFKLAVPHADKDPVVAGVKAGCNGCHSPMAFLSNDTPPPLPEKGERVNESVSCDVCHTISGFAGDTPFNFNYISQPGNIKYGPRGGVTSPEHEIRPSEFHRSAEFCGTCHNEKSPYGVWVKATHLEWKEGPYAAEGVVCQECHMPAGPGRRASMGARMEDIRQHLFHGAHDEGKLSGAVELRIHPNTRETEPGDKVVFTLTAFNQKAGHQIPTGSVEDRIVWVHVEATDSKGKVYHLPVDPLKFEGEEYNIGSEALAYQDMALPLDDPQFKGLPRDGVPVGDRIYRKPYFDPQGRMTLMQWNTKSQGADYRLPPRGSRTETYSWNVPFDIAPGKVTVRAVINYQRLVEPAARFLGVPEDEYKVIRINEHSTEIMVFD
jgi:hypothetical protein